MLTNDEQADLARWTVTHRPERITYSTRPAPVPQAQVPDYAPFAAGMTGIGADLDTRHRQRTWADRMPSREDVIAGTVIAVVAGVCLVGLANLVSIAVP